MVSKETRNIGKYSSLYKTDDNFNENVPGKVIQNRSNNKLIIVLLIHGKKNTVIAKSPRIYTSSGTADEENIYNFHIENGEIKSIHDADDDAVSAVLSFLCASEPATKEREKNGNMRDAKSIDGAISRILKAAPDMDAALLEKNIRAAFKAAEAGIALPADLEIGASKNQPTFPAKKTAPPDEPALENHGSQELFQLIKDEDFPRVWDAFTAAYIARGYGAAEFSAVVAHPNNATAHVRLRRVAKDMLKAKQALSQKTDFNKAKIDVELTSPPKRFDHTLPLGLTDTQIASLWTREKWRARKDKSEKFPDFLKRVYGDLLGHGLIPSDFRRKDPTTGKPYEQPLYQARLDWLKHSPMPVDIDLPDKDEVTDRLAYAIATNPASVPFKIQGRVKLAVASRDVRKLAI